MKLGKIRRIVKKAATQVETLLVLDATLGQNGLQAEVFAQAATKRLKL